MYIVSFLTDSFDIVTLGADNIKKLNNELVEWYSHPENSFSDNADNMVIYELVQTSNGHKLEQVTDFNVNLIPQIAEW
jgi:hypothetical protein